jgi:hypothetical protein
MGTNHIAHYDGQRNGYGRNVDHVDSVTSFQKYLNAIETASLAAKTSVARFRK